MSGFGSHPMCSLALARQQHSSSLLSKGLWKESCPGKAKNMAMNGGRALTSDLSSDSTRRIPPELEKQRSYLSDTQGNPTSEGLLWGLQVTHSFYSRQETEAAIAVPSSSFTNCSSSGYSSTCNKALPPASRYRTLFLSLTQSYSLEFPMLGNADQSPLSLSLSPQALMAFLACHPPDIYTEILSAQSRNETGE